MILDIQFLPWAVERVGFGAVAIRETAIKAARRHPDPDVDPVASRTRAPAAGWTEPPVNAPRSAAGRSRDAIAPIASRPA